MVETFKFREKLINNCYVFTQNEYNEATSQNKADRTILKNVYCLNVIKK